MKDLLNWKTSSGKCWIHKRILVWFLVHLLKIQPMKNLFFLLTLLICVACSGPRVVYDYDTQKDFSKYTLSVPPIDSRYEFFLQKRPLPVTTWHYFISYLSNYLQPSTKLKASFQKFQHKIFRFRVGCICLREWVLPEGLVKELPKW